MRRSSCVEKRHQTVTGNGNCRAKKRLRGEPAGQIICRKFGKLCGKRACKTAPNGAGKEAVCRIGHTDKAGGHTAREKIVKCSAKIGSGGIRSIEPEKKQRLLPACKDVKKAGNARGKAVGGKGKNRRRECAVVGKIAAKALDLSYLGFALVIRSKMPDKGESCLSRGNSQRAKKLSGKERTLLGGKLLPHGGAVKGLRGVVGVGAAEGGYRRERHRDAYGTECRKAGGK